jgi:hypothetical protein
MVNVGTNGSGVETWLQPALKALTAPLINADNAGFLRDEAALEVVCVTDAPDQSGHCEPCSPSIPSPDSIRPRL